VDKSLVQFGDTGSGPGRYRLLETVRQYAAGQLAAQGPAAAGAARAAHRDHYLALAEAAAPHLVAADQTAWLDRLHTPPGHPPPPNALPPTPPPPHPGPRLAPPRRQR